jgi:hypothetical protein
MNSFSGIGGAESTLASAHLLTYVGTTKEGWQKVLGISGNVLGDLQGAATAVEAEAMVGELIVSGCASQHGKTKVKESKDKSFQCCSWWFPCGQCLCSCEDLEPGYHVPGDEYELPVHDQCSAINQSVVGTGTAAQDSDGSCIDMTVNAPGAVRTLPTRKGKVGTDECHAHQRQF